MNQLKNHVQLIGNLGKNPEVKRFESGKTRVSFSLATSETYMSSKGEKTVSTQWHQVVVWGELASLAESYLRKGRKVGIQGKLTYRSYEDQQGNKRYLTEIVAYDILLLDKADKAPVTPAPQLDELPF